MKHFKILFYLPVISIILMIWVFLVSSAKASWAPLKKGANPQTQEFINYAWHISQDKSFIMTIERESGFSLGAISPMNYDGSVDRGIMQLNSRYHGAFINSPEFGDYKHQLLYGAEVYARSGGKAFNGYFKRYEVYNRFIWYNN